MGEQSGETEEVNDLIDGLAQDGPRALQIVDSARKLFDFESVSNDEVYGREALECCAVARSPRDLEAAELQVTSDAEAAESDDHKDDDHKDDDHTADDHK